VTSRRLHPTGYQAADINRDGLPVRGERSASTGARASEVPRLPARRPSRTVFFLVVPCLVFFINGSLAKLLSEPHPGRGRLAGAGGARVPRPIRGEADRRDRREAKRHITLFTGVDVKLPIKRVIVGPSERQAENAEFARSIVECDVVLSSPRELRRIMIRPDGA
jgi:hypothetical protein